MLVHGAPIGKGIGIATSRHGTLSTGVMLALLAGMAIKLKIFAGGP